jgi:hypothetical protein
MTIEPMLTGEMPANALVARVIEEAGNRDGLRHLRRPHRPDRLGAQHIPSVLHPHGASARGVAG